MRKADVFLILIVVLIGFVGAVETLYVDSFDSANIDWTASGTPPYLGDNIDNITIKSDGAIEGNFGFVNSSVGLDNIDNVTLYLETSALDAPGDDGIRIFIFNGSEFTEIATIQPSSTTYAWETLSLTSVLDTWGKINAAEMYVVYSRITGPNDIFIRRAYLYVDSTDTVAPDSIEFVSPTEDNDSEIFRSNIQVNVTATDSGIIDSILVELYNSSGSLIDSGIGSGSPFFVNFTGLSDGVYYFNATVNDTFGNSNSTGSRTVTINSLPDFTLDSSDISLDGSGGLIEGVNATVGATVWNVGNLDGVVDVEFYDGDPEASGVLIGIDSLFVSAGSSNVSEINWSVEIGPNDIFVLLDPPIVSNGSVEEINESNNVANRVFDIGAWQEFYGNTDIGVRLSGGGSLNINSWGNDTVLDGNVFIADKESSIDWLSLIAIGINDVGGSSSNDFSEIDVLLGMTGFSDSVSNVFSNVQVPKNTLSFYIHGNNISDVPIINSTDNSNFVTGIVWDDSDDTNGEYDSVDGEDLVFISKMNRQSVGKYGVYDYEINIPVKLRSYDSAEESEVYLYYDLN